MENSLHELCGEVLTSSGIFRNAQWSKQSQTPFLFGNAKGEKYPETQ
jgi:hypothetical protein